MIEVRNLCKEFEKRVILDDVSTQFDPGRVHLIIGGSGAGKTVFMKMLIGIFASTSGEVLYDGRAVSSLSSNEIKSLRKRMGVLFQGGALFDSMTVLDNVLFPLEMLSSLGRKERLSRVRDMLFRVGLQDAEKKYPGEISGGMVKRVAIARALILQPQYLFCDEPNSGLDPTTAQSIDELLSSLTREHGITTVINTHDMNTVRSIGDHILFLLNGKIGWEGSKEDTLREDLPMALRAFLNVAPQIGR